MKGKIATKDSIIDFNQENLDKCIRSNELAWIHLTTKDPRELESALQVFDIHALTLEDFMNPISRVKFEEFPNYRFFIFRGIRLKGYNSYGHNFNFLIRDNLLITHSREERECVDKILSNWNQNSDLLARGLEFIAYKIMDIETDQMIGVIHRLEDIVDEAEDTVYKSKLDVDLSNLFIIRGELQHTKRIIQSHKELLDQLNRIEFFSQDSIAFFNDLQDHNMRVWEESDNIIHSINALTEAYITLSTNRTNDIMKTLTVLTAIMLPISLIAGIFGMNFKWMPGLEWRHGFLASLGMMGMIGALMAFLFRRKRWF